MAIDNDKLASGLTTFTNLYMSFYELHEGDSALTGGTFNVHPAVKALDDALGVFDDDRYEQEYVATITSTLADISEQYKDMRDSIVELMNEWLEQVAAEELDFREESVDADSVMNYFLHMMAYGAQSFTTSVVSLGSTTEDLVGVDASGHLPLSVLGPFRDMDKNISSGCQTYNQRVLDGNHFQLTCSDDSTAGSEVFDATCSKVSEGGDDGVTITVTSADSQSASGETISPGANDSLVIDGDFDCTLSNVGTSVAAYWADASSNVANFSTASGNTYRSIGLALLASGAGTTTAYITQYLTSLDNTSQFDYMAVTFLAKVGTATSGTLNVKMVGTNYTAEANEQETIDASTASSDWTRYTFYFTIPRKMESDFGVRITNTNLNGTVLVDELVIAQTYDLQGVAMILPRDHVDYTESDRFRFTSSNDKAGKVAHMLAIEKNVNAPTSGSPTYPDS